MTNSAEIRRRSNLPNFESSHHFQPIPTYQSQQDSGSLPGTQPPVFQRYLEVGTSLYNPSPRISAYHDSPHGFIETIPTVDPHVLHQVPSHRHSSWDDSGVGSNYDGTVWTAGVRDQNYRHQMAYESSNQGGYREDYQYSTVSKPGLVLLRTPLALLYWRDIINFTRAPRAPRASIFRMTPSLQLPKDGDPASTTKTERKT